MARGSTNDRTFLTSATNWARLPFLFAVLNETRPDLTGFGSGRAWQRQVRVEAVDAEDIVEAVAGQITTDRSRPETTDFVYLTPRLSTAAALVAARCARPAADAHD